MAIPHHTLPLLGLPKDAVLLPGATLRVPTKNGPAMLSLLLHLLRDPVRSKAPPSGSLLTPPIVACFPLRPSRLEQESGAVAPSTVLSLEQDIRSKSGDFGTTAKIVSLDGRSLEGATLVLQGVSRCRLLEITQTRPFLKGTVEVHGGDGTFP